MAKYRVKPGHQFGARKQHAEGAIVELTEQEAAGFLDKLELVRESKSAPQLGLTLVEGGLLLTQEPLQVSLRGAILAASDEELIAIPGIGEKSVEAVRAWARGEITQGNTGNADNAATKDVETQLEAETGKDFAQTGTNPPTLAETAKPAPDANAITGGDNSPVSTATTPEQENATATGGQLLTTGEDATNKGKGKSKP